MNKAQFDLLPALLTRAQVVACGVPENAVDELRRNKTLGAVQLPGRHCKTAAKAKWKYRKSDVAAVCGMNAK